MQQEILYFLERSVTFENHAKHFFLTPNITGISNVLGYTRPNVKLVNRDFQVSISRNVPVLYSILPR